MGVRKLTLAQAYTGLLAADEEYWTVLERRLGYVMALHRRYNPPAADPELNLLYDKWREALEVWLDAYTDNKQFKRIAR